jgi:outer membrane protein OmpA-like peptidoglycan-associated protein
MVKFKTIKSIICFAWALLLGSAPLFGQNKGTLSLGILAEANANTRHGYGLAGGITGHYSFTDHIAAGLKADYGTDFYDVSSAEGLAFLRYFFNLPIGFSIFIQAGGGAIALFEEDRMVISGLGDGAVGVRFPMKNFYAEQYIRGGWPTGFGFGIVIGYRFGYKPPEPEPEYHWPQPLTEYPVIPPDDIEIFFFGFASNFEVLGPGGIDALTDNLIKLNTIAEFMKDYPEYRVMVTGHAFPVEGSEAENRSRLIPLSQRRAEFVKGELIKLGIDSSRITTRGIGGQENESATTSNRRVTFKFEK